MTATSIMMSIFVPSMVCLVTPLLLITTYKRGTIVTPVKEDISHHNSVVKSEQMIVLYTGVAGLLFVPIFKNITHLPPFMGILLSLGILWVLTELMRKRKDDADKFGLSVAHVMQKIDMPSILFFLGILLAVASLQTSGHLTSLAASLDSSFGDIYVINILIGLFSSIVDNVPLVAGSIGMYPLSTYGVDHPFWELLALCAGTGCSALIIGSAAGVAIMGILKIDFIWYMK